MKIIDFIITVFTVIDDFCQIFFAGHKLRQRGFQPKLADSEVMTMEVVGEFLGIHTDKGIYQYFKTHWQPFFPKLPHRSNFVRQAANLAQVKEQLFEYLRKHSERWLQIVDSMPIEVCKFVRAKYARLFKGAAAYGKWFGQTFFGFKAHLKITHLGMIRGFALAPANVADIRCVPELLNDDSGGFVLGDRGYRSEPLRQKLWDVQKICFHATKRRNESSTSPWPKETIKRFSGIRRLIETVAGQLEQQFALKTTSARDLRHLGNRIMRKILSHTMGVWLNIKLNNDPLKLKALIE